MKKNEDSKNASMEVEVRTPLTPVDLTNGNLPNLEDADEIPLDLMSNYWSPVQHGETKRVFFDCIKMRQVQDNANPDVLIDLPCAFFFEKVKGEIKTISNGSKRLVAAIESNNLKRFTPLSITYLGKKRNSTNSFLSDDWRVTPLSIKAT